jgi:hypothetical protein
MTALLWDELGTRYYEAGVDRGVLYPPNSPGVPWNGLIAVNERVSGNEGAPVYFDGVKFANVLALGEFSASVRAYTYPDEFLQFEGVLEVGSGNGLYVGNQQLTQFGMSYRTMVGNDVDEEAGYKIHVLYNLTAVPAQKNFQTIPTGSAVEFEWTVTAIPGKLNDFRPTAHVIFDTREMSTELIQDIEETLYGDEFNDARLPALSTLTSFVGEWVIIRVTDHEDGTFTIEAPDDLLTMLDATTWQLIQANAVYLDEVTYRVSNKSH